MRERRSSTYASIELPDGVGLSSRSFLRATSCSPSARREEEAAALVVAEELDREPREPVRLLEPAQLAGRGVQLEQAVRDVRVVVEVARVPSLARRARCGGAGRPRRTAARAGTRPSARARVDPVGPSSRAPASANAASARPFQDAIALSSRAAAVARSRSSSSAARASAGVDARRGVDPSKLAVSSNALRAAVRRERVLELRRVQT